VTDDQMTFQPGVLGSHDSVKGFEVLAVDGRAGRVSWASYKPGESYLVVTTRLLRRRHRVLPAGAVTGVGDGEVRVSLTRAAIEHLPLLSRPDAPVVDSESYEQTMNAVARAYAEAGFPRQ
jgi:hypothetical protein